jgi:hypothetical protein
MFVNRQNKKALEYKASFCFYFEGLKTLSEMPRRAREKTLISKLKGNELGVITYTVLPVLFSDILADGREEW